MRDDCCIYIISYKRAKNNPTFENLKKYDLADYTYIIVANDDEQLEEYIRIYGKKVKVFDRKKTLEKFDICDNFSGLVGSVFPRNAINQIAQEMGINYYLVLDDDYDRFSYRRCFGNVLRTFKIKDFQSVIEKCFEYIKKAKNIDCIAFSQEGDYIGGAESFTDIGGKRKIMNAFFFKTKKIDYNYIGRLNEDVNTYLYWGQRGKLFFTINDVSVRQKMTQANAGGMTELYKDAGTYLKTFYSVIVAPNCVKVNSIGTADLRIHHKIKWNYVCPKLIREEYKK